MCLPGECERIQALVDDALAHGATVRAGGSASALDGQFYPPTVVCVANAHLSSEQRTMRLLHEEVLSSKEKASSFVRYTPR